MLSFRTNNFLYLPQAVRPVPRYVHSLSYTDIVPTTAIVGIMRVYIPALLLVEGCIEFQSVCVPLPFFSLRASGVSCVCSF